MTANWPLVNTDWPSCDTLLVSRDCTAVTTVNGMWYWPCMWPTNYPLSDWLVGFMASSVVCDVIAGGADDLRDKYFQLAYAKDNIVRLVVSLAIPT
jgi:hypothetical protein